jgi:CheY-like chemotaxis protein
LRALVVDDNPLARTVLIRLLEKFGCEVQAADSGEAALAILQDTDTSAFDYVTIDFNMPGMDGLTLASKIRQSISASPKLVLVTAADTHAMEEAGQLSQFNGVLNKPITAAQIGEMLTGKPALSQPKSTGNAQELKGLRVLLAEDIPTNQLIATEMLQAYGVTVDVVDNGRLAVEAMQAHGHRFDLILMDMQMPEMDGLEATRQIRQRFPDSSIPIIAMTAHALDEERERCMAAGMNDFITKPVDPQLLESSLLRWKPGKLNPAPASTPQKEDIAVESASTDPFENLPGIDVAGGMRRMMNKRALYERVLRDFHKRFAGEAALIRAALSANDAQTAERHAHSTKGLAGSIGATELQEAALALEEAIRAANTYPEAALERYETALKIVIDGIGLAFPAA